MFSKNATQLYTDIYICIIVKRKKYIYIKAVIKTLRTRIIELKCLHYRSKNLNHISISSFHDPSENNIQHTVCQGQHAPVILEILVLSSAVHLLLFKVPVLFELLGKVFES